MFYVYVLQSQLTDRFYVGYSEDRARRSASRRCAFDTCKVAGAILSVSDYQKLMAAVYILYSNNLTDSIYVGLDLTILTGDLNSIIVFQTLQPKPYRPFILFWSKTVRTRTVARRREKYLKVRDRKEFLKSLKKLQAELAGAHHSKPAGRSCMYIFKKK
jgi:predicted GIY-YIG superfamily endonuclease